MKLELCSPISKYKYIYPKPEWIWSYVHQSVTITCIFENKTSKIKLELCSPISTYNIYCMYKNTQLKLELCSPISKYNIYLQKIPKWKWSYVHQSVSITYVIYLQQIPKWNWSYVYQSVSITYIYKKTIKIEVVFTNQ